MTKDILLDSYIALLAFEHLPKNDTINNWFLITTFASLEMAICKNKQSHQNDVRDATIKRTFCTRHYMTTTYTLYVFSFHLSEKY